MWVLMLNHMRDAKIEMRQPITRADTKEELIAFLAREKCEPYSEPGEGCYGSMTWHKSHRKGGPLEWHNPPSPNDDTHFQHVGTVEEWMESARLDYEQRIIPIPLLPVEADLIGYTPAALG